MKNKTRTKKLIKPALQMRLILVFGCIALASVLIQAVMLNRALTQVLEQMPNDGQALLGRWPELLLGNVLITFALVVPVTLILGTLATFRIAGPLHRIETHLRDVAAGKGLEPCRVRQADELQDLCELVNRAIDAARTGRSAAQREEPESSARAA